jgi:hypothetical protein
MRKHDKAHHVYLSSLQGLNASTPEAGLHSLVASAFRQTAIYCKAHAEQVKKTPDGEPHEREWTELHDLYEQLAKCADG